MLESNVKIGVTEISPRAVQQAAELNFKNGFCNRYGFRYGCRRG